jgi:gliding motility-associated-like protein
MNERHTYAAPGTYNVSLTVTNNFDCKNVITKEVVILPEFRFWVPNAFTPSGDGLNDVFKPLAIGIKDYKMEIYDRGGQRLFYSYELDKGWDGQYKGKPCKQDSYIWKAHYTNEVTGKYTTETGHVTLFNEE